MENELISECMIGKLKVLLRSADFFRGVVPFGIPGIECQASNKESIGDGLGPLDQRGGIAVVALDQQVRLGKCF